MQTKLSKRKWFRLLRSTAPCRATPTIYRTNSRPLSSVRQKTARTFLQVLAISLIAILSHKEAEASFEAQRILIGDIPDGTPGLAGAVRPRRDEYVGGSRSTSIEPLLLYQGKWLFSDGTSGGVHLFDNDWLYLDLYGRFRFTKLVPEDHSEIPDGVRQRDSTIEGGFATGLRTPLGELRVEWGRDLLDRHDGESLELTYRYTFENGNIKFSPFLTVSFLDANLANYYYGVSETESQASGIPSYEVGDTTNLSFGLNSYWQVNEHFFMFANVGIEALNDDIVNSPIVNEDFAAELFVGGGYFFGSMKDSKYVSPERAGEWSWRLNYGYAGDNNIVPDPPQGGFEPSELAVPKIAGLTLGKLVMDGPRMDVYAKLAVYRHFGESGGDRNFTNIEQDDYWSFAPYIMGIGKGYFPWSDKVAFRWGFGIGASYAQRIPLVEQLKQMNKGATSNRLLTYLEWMVDVPIDTVIRTKLVKDCYAGVTVAHRSGLFSWSRANDDVRGGSDYYTIHLECLR